MRRENLQMQITETMAQARSAIDELGLCEAAFQRIQLALVRLAAAPGLIDLSSMSEVHGSGVGASVLASEGPEGLTLVFARFPEEPPTPVHDHNTWGIICVVEGYDMYTQWERMDDGRDPETARLRIKYSKVLGPGDLLYYPGPPDDIHSQHGNNGTVFELVLFGRNAMLIPRHYFDLETGKVTLAMPQLRSISKHKDAYSE